MARRFHTLDVFTGTPLAGNPLAVVHDAEDLDTPRMQAIAAEFNLSETVFVLPPDDPVNTARLRIFTPQHEIPFAGHPTVGAAVLIATLRAPELIGGQGVVIALEEAIGLVPCEVRRSSRQATRAIFPLPRLPALGDRLRTADAVAATLGLAASDIVTDGYCPEDYNAGLPYTIVPVATRDALARARPLLGPAFDAAYGGLDPGNAPYVVWRHPGGGRFHARMFAPHLGIPEDPATGSAVACLAGAIAAHEGLKDGAHQVIVHQGEDMGRPAEIVLTLTMAGGRLEGATIGGAAVIVSEGTLAL
jgi:trans-2,3-dihydro-3-hydroxyanthranilate isomerase